MFFIAGDDVVEQLLSQNTDCPLADPVLPATRDQTKGESTDTGYYIASWTYYKNNKVAFDVDFEGRKKF